MGNPLRLLVFSPFYPPHTGGLESHSDEFNKHLSQQGVAITVFTPRLPASASERETCHAHVQIIRFPACEPIHNYPVPKFWLPIFWKLLREASTNKPNCIVSRTRFFSTSFFALLYAKCKRLPLVHIEHGSDFAQFNGKLKTFLGKLYDFTFGRIVLSYADVCIGNSQASAQFVKQLSGRIDCRVIYRGANIETIESIKPDVRIRERHPGRVVIAFIGRLIDGKGVRDLIAAVSQLKNQNAVLIIIGSGPEETPLRKLASEQLRKGQIEFLGNLPFQQAISILKSTDIVVNPSYTEGLPTSVTEAALCHKTIVATDVGGTREIITGDGDGFLIQPRNTDSLREKLSRLIQDPHLRATFGEKAYRGVRSKFSWDQSIDQYETVFKSILETKRSSL